MRPLRFHIQIQSLPKPPRKRRCEGDGGKEEGGEDERKERKEKVYMSIWQRTTDKDKSFLITSKTNLYLIREGFVCLEFQRK